MKKLRCFGRMCLLLPLITVLSFSPVMAQNKSLKNTSDERSPTGFFQKKNLMSIGAYYYPEQWPRSQWERDLNNMGKLGFEFTHFAEFAWTYMEPEEGKFEFGWLDEAIDLAAKAGMKVIMCTPSLCPPAWMGEKYPEIYLVGSDGQRKEHGVRANASLANLRYQALVEQIVLAMAEHYGKDKRIMGWQVDNEPLATPDYSTSSRKAFQEWLKNKYGTIDQLNESWVGNFWSTRYDNFEQVLIPNEAMNGEDKLSPHALLDFQRYTASVTAGFLNHQSDLLRKYILPSQWITTNYTNVCTSADPRLSDHLDFPTYTLYPVSGRNELGGVNFRTGNPYRLYEANDYYRPIKGTTGIMELQPGQVNWASINPQLLPGTVHMWLMQAFGGGCSFVCTYRYRHLLGTSEMYHEGIVGTDGVNLSQGGKEFVQGIQDLKILRANFDANSILPEKLAKRKTAILWSHDVMWDLDLQRQTTSWNTWKNRNNYTSAVKSTGSPMDFISETDDFSAYPVLIAPAYQLIDDKLVKKWTEYVENGGHLILSCRSGMKDKNGHFFEGSWAAPITSLLGAKVDFFDMLLPDDSGKITTKDNNYTWNCWSDILSPEPETEVLASYADQYYAGKAAATTRKLGKGTVTYVGAYSTDGRFEREMVRQVYRNAGIEIEDLPKGFYVEWRDGFWVAVNYTGQAFKFRIPENSQILIGKNPLQAAEALVWKENK
jgi:beta-galactosidase